MFYLLIPIEDVLRSACTASDTSVKDSCTFDRNSVTSVRRT